MKESDHYENEMYFVKSDCFSTYVDMYRGGYMSFATEVKSDVFFKKADAQKVIEVKDNTTVTPSPSDPIVVESYGVGKYKINVADGKNLELRNLYMNNPVIQGNGNITLSVDEDAFINSGFFDSTHSNYYGNSLLVTGKGNDAVITGKSITISNKQANKYNGDKNGIFMDDGSSRNLSMTADDKVSVSGAYHGITSEPNTTGDISIKAGSMDIASKGWGIFMNGANKVDIDASDGFTLKGGQGISNNGSEAITVKSTDGDTYIKAGTLFGVTAQNGSISITAKNNTVDVVNGTSSIRDYYAGVRSYRSNANNYVGNVDIKATDGNNIITTGTNVDGVYAASDKITIDAPNGANEINAGKNGLRATKDENPKNKYPDNYLGGEIYLHAGKSNTVIADQNAMYATYDGVITVTSDEGRSMMEGNVVAAHGGKISADYNTSDSYLLGTVKTYYNGKTTDSSTKLNFKNGGRWLVTDNSNVSYVDFSGGIINMTQNIKGNAHKVSIDKALNGSGTFMMDLKYLGNSVDTYKNALDSDFVYIHGGDGSTQQLAFTPGGDNLGSMHSGDKLYFAEIANGAANFASDTVTNANKSGIYDQQFMINSEGTSSNYKDWFITCLGNTVNPNGDTPIASHHAGFALWRDDDTLLKRLGELRYSSPDGQIEDGIWARLIGKKLSYQHSDYGFVTHAKTLEIGYDKKKLTQDQKGTWWRGVAVGHTWGRTDFNGGSGDNDFTDFKYYSTNIRQHDHYMDFVARIGRLDSDYDTNYGDHADYKNWAGSLSIEYGRKKKIDKRNWYIEPQSQMTYSYIWGRDYTTKNGISVHQDDSDSLVGRLGFVLSREFGDKRPDHNRFYLKAAILHEFLGGNNDHLYYNGTYLHDDMDFDGTWYILGTGFNADVSDNCNFYFDIEKAYNSDIDLSYRVEGGFRWEW